MIDTAIILCDIKNYSLKEHTKNTPISLIEINNEKILKKQLDILENCGIINIYLTVGFGGKQIIDFVKSTLSFENLNINFIPNHFWKTTNTSYSLLLALEKMEDKPFIVLEGNKLFNKELISSILNNNKENICLVKKKKYDYSPRSLKVLVNPKSNKVLKIDKDTRLDYQKKKWMKRPKKVGYSLGVYKFSNLSCRIRKELRRNPIRSNFEYSINEILGNSIIFSHQLKDPMELVKVRNTLDLKKAQEIL